MEVRDISRDRQTRKSLSRSPAADICGDATDNLDPLGLSRIHDGASTNSIDRDAVDQIGVPPLLSGADIAGEEAKRIGRDGGKPKPSDLSSNNERHRDWEKWYQGLWK